LGVIRIGGHKPAIVNIVRPIVANRSTDALSGRPVVSPKRQQIISESGGDSGLRYTSSHFSGGVRPSTDDTLVPVAR